LFVEGEALDKQKIKPQITANPKEPKLTLDKSGKKAILIIKED
jgi:hypothetical protein